MNAAVVIGRASGPADVRYVKTSVRVGSGSVPGPDRAVGHLAVATQRSTGATNWVRVQLTGKLAEQARDDVRPGTLVCVTGRVEYDDDKQGYVMASTFRILTDAAADPDDQYHNQER